MRLEHHLVGGYVRYISPYIIIIIITRHHGKTIMHALACGQGRSGKGLGRVPLRDIPCICAPVNTNLPLITECFCPYVLFAGLTLTKDQET